MKGASGNQLLPNLNDNNNNYYCYYIINNNSMG